MKYTAVETMTQFGRRSACVALLGVFLVGCGSKGDKSAAEPHTQNPPQTQTQPKRPFPAHVLSDTYAGGVRTVTLRPKHPEVLLQVIELCHGDDLITETQRVRSDGGGKYTQTTALAARKDSDCIGDSEITSADQRPIPTPHPLQKTSADQQSFAES